MVYFYTAWKNQKTKGFVFREYRKRPAAYNGLTSSFYTVLINPLYATALFLYPLETSQSTCIDRNLLAYASILITMENGNRIIMETFRIMSRPSCKMRQRKQICQLRWISSKVISIKQTISVIFRRLPKHVRDARSIWPTNRHELLFQMRRLPKRTYFMWNVHLDLPISLLSLLQHL